MLLCLRLTANVEAVPRARHALRRVLAAYAPGAPGDVIELLLSELVTNAVRHSAAAGTVGVSLLRRDGAMRVAVVDTDPVAPGRGRTAAGPLDEHGRGLLLVEALSEEWGSHPVPGGKVVWCDVKPTA